MSADARFRKDINLYGEFRLFDASATKAQKARIAALKSSGAWKQLEVRDNLLREVADAELEYRRLTGKLTRADKAEFGRFMSFIDSQIGPSGEVYGHRG